MNLDTFKDIRHFKEMTQQQYADWLGLSLSSIAMIESGQRRVTDNIRGKLAHKFMITDEFIEYQERRNKLIG